MQMTRFVLLTFWKPLNMPQVGKAITLLAGGLMVLNASVVSSQEYPSKPIRIITSAAGASIDVLARQIAQGVSGPLGQPVIVDNRTPLLAAEAVFKAPPDGYTLQVAGSSLWIGLLLRTAPYDVVRDFAPISLLTTASLVLTVHPSMPVKSVKELISLAKVKSGGLNYASGVTGSPTHLSAELFKSMARVDIVRIPYKGGGPAMTDLLAGQVHMYFPALSSAMPHAKSGRLRALALTSATPSALFPGLPTIASAGLPGYESTSMQVLLAPAKTPATIINRLNREVVRVLNLPDVKERLLDSEVEPVGSSPEELASTIRSDMAKWGKLIKDAGIKVE